MSATDIVIGRVLPRIASVASSPPYRLSVTWASGDREGKVDTIDIAPMLFGLKLYRPLREDPELFGSAHVAAYGSAVAWGEDEAIDISAVALEELAGSAMTAADFQGFLARNKLTLDMAAAQLGISRRLVAYYAKGREVPRLVMLACRHLDSRARLAEP